MKNITPTAKTKINYFFTLVLIFSTTIIFGQTGSCTADLRVYKDRNVRSTPPEGTYYSMVLTNNGTSADTFTLATQVINSSCTNPDGSSNLDNVDLTASFFDSALNPITEISLNTGQSTSFFAHITVPIGTPAGKWCCTEVSAESQLCSGYKANTDFHTLVINPNDN